MTNQFIQCAHAKFCHIFPKFLCNEFHEIHDIFRLTAEILTKFRILCRNTNRTGIQITYTHHDATHRYQRCCRKSEFFRTQNRGNRHITTGHQFSVCFNTNFITKTVHNQCLVCLCKTKFPRKTGIMNGTSRCCTGTSVITGNENHLCACLCHAGCNRTNARFGNKLHADSCILIGIL